MVFLGSEEANKSKKELVGKYGEDKVMLYDCDITDKASLKAGFDEAKGTFERIDIVCNCGSSWDEIEWEKTIQISLVSCYYFKDIARQCVQRTPATDASNSKAIPGSQLACGQAVIHAAQ